MMTAIHYLRIWDVIFILKFVKNQVILFMEFFNTKSKFEENGIFQQPDVYVLLHF